MTVVPGGIEEQTVSQSPQNGIPSLTLRSCCADASAQELVRRRGSEWQRPRPRREDYRIPPVDGRFPQGQRHLRRPLRALQTRPLYDRSRRAAHGRSRRS